MRMLGWLLAAYAALGIIFILAAAVIGGPLVARAERLSGDASSALEAATAAADAAADAFGGFDASVGQAHDSAQSAADLSRETSLTLDGLAQAMSVSIFGTQPLQPLAGQFSASAEQLRSLGDDLDGIGSALVTNRSDIDAVGSRMRTLADELDALRGGVATEASAGVPLSWLFWGFLLWQLLPVGAATVAASRLMVPRRTVVLTLPDAN
jgi:hypothetical protein